MKYRKKPVTIEARQLIGPASEWHAVYQWVEANTLGSFDVNQFWADTKGFAWPESGVSIDARDGRMVIASRKVGRWADPGDWIIKGWDGEFYPCKPEIFEATYEADFEEDFEEADDEPDPLDESNHADRYDRDGDRWVWCDACYGLRLGARHEVHKSSYGWSAYWVNEDYGPLTFAQRPADMPTTSKESSHD